MSERYSDLPYTSFPNNIDALTGFENITSEDLPKVNAFHQALEAGNYDEAQNILATITDWNKKLLDSNKLNKMRDALIALERYYGTDIEQYITEKETAWQNTMNQFGYVGEWNISSAYAKNNIVSRNYMGSDLLYIAITSVPANTDITDTNYWLLFTIEGQKGESGVGGTFKYEYSSAESYVKGDIVSYNNKLWYALRDCANVEPNDNNNTYWSLLLTVPPATAPLSSDTPTPPDSEPGYLWFEII